MPPTVIKTATGSFTRVRMQPEGRALIIHATVQTFDPRSGMFSAFLDSQPEGEAAYLFTPGVGAHFTDQNGLVWMLVE